MGVGQEGDRMERAGRYVLGLMGDEERERAERDLEIGRHISLISVATVFDTSRLSSPVDTIPLVPSASCDVAVELAIARLEEPGRDPVMHLISPDYRSVGSVARPG